MTRTRSYSASYFLRVALGATHKKEFAKTGDRFYWHKLLARYASIVRLMDANLAGKMIRFGKLTKEDKKNSAELLTFTRTGDNGTFYASFGTKASLVETSTVLERWRELIPKPDADSQHIYIDAGLLEMIASIVAIDGKIRLTFKKSDIPTALTVAGLNSDRTSGIIMPLLTPKEDTINI